eukprot:3855785-Heterocapsa_arctica.AAC.1
MTSRDAYPDLRLSDDGSYEYVNEPDWLWDGPEYDANIDGNEIAGAIAWYDHALAVEGDPHFVFVEPDGCLRDEGGRAAQLIAAC